MARLVPIEEEPRRPRLVPLEDAPSVPMTAEGTIPQAVGRSVVERLAHNITGLPDLVATSALNFPSPMNLIGGNTIPDPEAGPQPERTLFSDITGRQPPAIGERIIPGIPTGRETVAGIEAGVESVGGLLSGEPLDLRRRFGESIAESRQLAENRPFSSMFGGLVGDGLTLAGGRLPVARGIAQAEGRLMSAVPREQLLALEPSVARFANRALNSEGMRTLARGLGRSAETGLEGAALGILNGQDPAEVAGYAAAGQMLGSGTLSLTKGLVSGGPTRAGVKLGMAALSAGALIQMLKRSTPGGEDSLYESMEAGFDKVKYGLAVGALAGMAGGGRLRGRAWADDLPEITDAIAALPRGAMVSIIKEWRSAVEKGEGSAIENALERLAVPDFFDERTTNRLSRALQNERFGETVGKLIEEDEHFRRRLEAPVPAPGEIVQNRLREDIRADAEEFGPGVSARETARVMAERLGRRDVDSGRQFVTDTLRDESTAADLLPKLGKRTRLDALETNLASLISDSSIRVDGRRVVDAERLRQAWGRLPEVTRSAYSEPQRLAIENFIHETAGAEVSVLPTFAARSLMVTNSRLSRRLRGQPEEER